MMKKDYQSKYKITIIDLGIDLLCLEISKIINWD